ncbi:transmembrane protein 131-like [Watersipora subatra]|uniref:transmembrane protein 131-like n=1 Tax=Watersipora subatra TaxID=2589382 RepID=UPI00355B1D13
MRLFGQNKINTTLFIFTIHCLMCNSSCAPNNGQVFIQTDNELKFMVDGIPLPISSSDSLMFSDDDSGMNSRQDNTLSLVFTPPTLDFHTQSVGMPSLRRITVTNRLDGENIHLLSISGSTAHFHCSFFKEKIIQPGKNTTFDVVFLARQLGNVEHALKVQTDRGVFMYHVFGVGINNPFRLKPLLGARVPVNGSYSPIISMHNPFSDSLHVVEMFSSGGNIHLELPTGAAQASRSMWEIEPFQTKPVMRATYLANKITNDTGFIRIRTASLQRTDDLLIVPLEVEVSAEPGLYTPQNLLDFGILHSRSEPKSLPLFVINSSIKPIEIADIVVEPANEAISIDFRSSLAIEGNIEKMTFAATVTYSSLLKHKTVDIDKGNIVIISKQGARMTVPYQAHVEQGTLELDPSSDLIVHTSDIDQSSDLVRSLRVRNRFNRPLVIYNVSISEEVAWLKMTDIDRQLVIQPKAKINLVKLTINSAVKRIHGTVSAKVLVYTNVSVFTVSLHIYDGKLETVFQHNSKELDFGSLGFSETRELYFTLRNNNPVNVEIQDIYSTSVVTQVELFGVEEGKGSTLTRPPNLLNLDTDPLTLKANHFAVYKVKLKAPKSDGNYLVDIRVSTNFDTFYVPLKFRTSAGSVKSIPEKIVFDKAFPTKVPFKVLKIRSSFTHYTEVTKVSFLPDDSRFRYEPTKNTPTVLEPFQDTVIGHLYFDANNGSVNDSYAGLPLNSPGGLNWIAGLSLAPETDKVDTYLYNMFRNRWLSMQGHKSVNVTVQVDTEWIQNFLFPAQAYLIWPTLLQGGNRLRFTPTQVGNLTSMQVVVENPSHADVTIQIVPLSLYPNPQAMVNMLMRGSEMKKLRSHINHKEKDIFTLQNLERFNRKSNNPVPAYRQAIRENYGVMPHLGSISTTLLPGVRVSVSIGFQPRLSKSYVSLILIRNNLTVVDMLIVSGKGATSGLRVKEADSYGYLSYEIRESSLQCCSNNEGSDSSDSSIYELSHTFTLHNNGSLPVYIHGFEIAGIPCVHESFRVMNCTGFELAANESRVVELVYSPDFSSASVVADLVIHASNNLSKNLTVSIDIPARLLKQCRQSLPRPDWEVPFFWSAGAMMIILLVISLLLAYADMKKIFAASLYAAAMKGNRFDLKQLSEANASRQNGSTIQTKSSAVGQSCSPEVRRRNRNADVLLNNGTFAKPQANGDSNRSLANSEKRNSQSVKSLPQSDTNGSKASEPKKQASSKIRSVPPPTLQLTDLSIPSTSKASKLINTSAINKQSSSTAPPNKVTNHVVNNNLLNGNANKVSKAVNGSTQTSKDKEKQERLPAEPLQDANKHNHRNNLLRVDSETTTISAKNGQDSPTDEGVATIGLQVLEKEFECEEPAPDLPSPTLNEEARAKLQQNSRAQLKKQKKNNQPKQRAKKTSTTAAPTMITKAVGTADLEDSASLSTDSSNGARDGKTKVTDWLHKLPDRPNGNWSSSSYAQPADHMSVSSDAPSWDTVGQDTYDDLSMLADQTRDFAANIDMGMPSAATKVREPIGTRPQPLRFAGNNTSSWDFPSASADSGRVIPSPLGSPLVTPRATRVHPGDALTSQDPRLLQHCQEERRKREERNHIQRNGQGLDDWSSSLQESIWRSANWSPSDNLWNTSNWTPWAINDSGNHLTSSSGADSSSSPTAGLGLTSPSSSSQVNNGHYGLFSSSVWSTSSFAPSISTSFSTPTNSSAWSYEQASGDAINKDQ